MRDVKQFKHIDLRTLNFTLVCHWFSASLKFLIRFHSSTSLQNLKDQILTTNIWLEHEWQDHKFKWDPVEYGGVTELYVPSEHIWLPDIVLYNK